MFNDILLKCNIYAELDETLIKNTFRKQDLIPVFMTALRDSPFWNMKEGEMAPPCSAMDDLDDAWWDSDGANEVLNTLIDILQNHAPYSYYFGASQGNDSDFGYWKDESQKSTLVSAKVSSINDELVGTKIKIGDEMVDAMDIFELPSFTIKPHNSFDNKPHTYILYNEDWKEINQEHLTN